MKKIRSALRPFLAGLGILAIVLLSMKFYTSWQEENTPKEECKQKILSVLKSPSTAQFSNYIKISSDLAVYNVDAQNSYGAMIRAKYLCNLDPVSFQKEVLEIKGIENIEEIDYSSIKICILKESLGESFSNCLYEEERRKLRENTCNEAIELNQQGYLSGEHVNNICSSLGIEI